MSSDTNKTSENDTGDTFNDLDDLDEQKVVIQKYPNSEANVMKDERFHSVHLGYENIPSDLPEDSDIDILNLDKSESGEIFNNCLYDKCISHSSLQVLYHEKEIYPKFYIIDKYNHSSLSYSNNSSLPPIYSIKEANASESSQINANLNENIKTTTATKTAIMPLLPETPFERKTKRMYESSQSVKSSKRCKTCKSINTRYPDGEMINASQTISDEDIRKYEEFKNRMEKCEICKKNISVSKVFLVDNNYICEKCAKIDRINVLNLRTDLYDTFDYTGEKLYKCKRLSHARPLYQFIKYSVSNGSYRVLTNCCYCRLYKSQENVIKKY